MTTNTVHPFLIPAPVRRRTLDGCEVRELDDGSFLMGGQHARFRVPPMVLAAIFASAVAS